MPLAGDPQTGGRPPAIPGRPPGPPQQTGMNMRGTSEFYEIQIGLCGQQAAAAGLDNQRTMYLRAQAAWQQLANAEAKVQVERAKRLADRPAV